MGLFDRFKKKNQGADADLEESNDAADQPPHQLATEGTLDEEQQPIFAAMAEALIEATPEWWTSATLELTSDREFGSGLSQSISTPDYPQDVVVATDELMEATRALELACVRHGDSWQRCLFRIHQNPDETWGYLAEFER